MACGLAVYTSAQVETDTDNLDFATDCFNDFDDLSETFSKNGWALGAGFETRLSGNWALMMEYRYNRFRTFEVDIGGYEDRNYNVKTGGEVDTSFQTVRADVIYRF